MAAIPSWGWLFVGALVTGTAWYADMPMFFWLGLAFITFGVFKLVIGFMLGKKVTKQEKKQVQAAPQAHKYYRCQCGNPVRSNDVFCSYCGRRLR
jgi:hypothetical protein